MSSSDLAPVGFVRVVGNSNVGKTTLIERLIPRLRGCAIRVGTVKHAHHGFDLDHPGKDSWRHTEAGAQAVALISPTSAAWFMQTSEEISCGAAIEKMRDHVDLVLVEGFKKDSGPFIILEPGTGSRIEIDGWHCKVGVKPDELTEDEVKALVEFCLSAIQVNARCRSQLQEQ